MKPLLLVLAFTIAVAGASAITGTDNYAINWTGTQARTSATEEGIYFVPLINSTIQQVCKDPTSQATYFEIYINGTGTVYASNLTGNCAYLNYTIYTNNQYGIQFGHTSNWNSTYWNRGASTTNTITGTFSRIYEGILNNAPNDFFYNIENITFSNDTQNFTIQAFNGYTLSAITSFNATVNWNGTTTNYTTTTGVITTSINTVNSTFPVNVTVSSSNYFDNTTTGITTFNHAPYLLTHTEVRAFAIGSGAAINNFTLFWISNTNNSYNGTTTTSTGLAYAPIFNGTFELYVYDATNGTNFAYGRANVTGNPYNKSYNFTLYLTNSLLISFVDEETGILLNGTTITAYITGSIASYNYTTNNGYLNATLLNPQNYTITYGGGNYNQREYNVEITNQTFQFLVLYLLNNNTGTYIRFTVLDQTYQTLEGAAVNAQKKNLSGTNYFTVADCTTDNNGECILFLETLTTTYRFVTDYQTTTRTTSDTILSRDTYTIVLNTGTSTLQQVLDRDDIVAGLNYTAPGSFYYTVDDSTNNVQTGLLVVERRYGGRLYPVSSSTTSGSSFTLSVTGVNTTLGDEIIASGYVYVDGQPILTHRVSVIESSAGTAIGGGLAFLFLGMMFTIVFIFAWNPVAPLVAFGAFVIIMSRIGIISMGGPAVVAIIIVLGVAIYRMRSV